MILVLQIFTLCIGIVLFLSSIGVAIWKVVEKSNWYIVYVMCSLVGWWLIVESILWLSM